MRISLLIFLAFISLHASSQATGDTAAQIEKIFARYQSQNPGCQLSISRNGSIIFSKAWGMADMQNTVPLTTKSIIEAGSVSKQFTAAAILLLEQQGKLSLEDNLRKYVPEIPDYGTVIKLKHLIHHTSGLKDWGTIAELTGWGRGTKAYRNEDALEIIARQKTLNNIPGAEFLYSNSNYNLLAIIVQRVSGMTLADYTKKYIFTPAEMTQTQWRDNYRRIVPRRAIAYQKTASAYEMDMFYEDAYGNGGLLTTTEDLLKWNEFYSSGKLGQPSLLQKQITPDTLNNRRLNYYCAGLLSQSSKGQKVIMHDGATGSYRAYLSYYPDLQLTFAWLSNTSEFDTSGYNVSAEVEAIFIKRPPSRSAVNADILAFAVGKPETYVGWYRNTRTSGGLEISFVNGRLLVDNRTELLPIAENRFKLGSDLFVFDAQKNFRRITEKYDTVNYQPVMSADYNLKNIKAYTGIYYSDEADARITITQKADTLFMVLNSYSSYRLQPLYRNAFRIVDFGGILNFTRNKSDILNKLTISLGRAREVSFEKKE